VSVSAPAEPRASEPAPGPTPAHPTPRGRWVATDWSALPGWEADATVMAWPALLRSCQRPAAGWAPVCDAARALGQPDEAQVRRFLEQRLRPWRVETHDGRADGLITGYFEPLVEASRQRGPRHTVPLYAPPADLASRRPWFSRAEIDQSAQARAALRGREIAWVADPLDALMLQIQGSGRLLIEEGGTRRTVRLAYAGHNDHPYRSVGRWLVDQGAFTLEQANWPAIKAWARANPRRVTEMLQANPRFIFFREEALPDPSVGPVGAQGVPLTPGRSIAVDRESIPYGTPVWLDTTEPQPWQPDPPPSRPLRRLVLAQDTGSAITGAVRADYFWGWGDGAEDRAGRMKQPLRFWALWPRDAALPAWPAAAPGDAKVK
jgi:membrane-bound lytic murein transglycosylase A